MFQPQRPRLKHWLVTDGLREKTAEVTVHIPGVPRGRTGHSGVTVRNQGKVQGREQAEECRDKKLKERRETETNNTLHITVTLKS